MFERANADDMVWRTMALGTDRPERLYGDWLCGKPLWVIALGRSGIVCKQQQQNPRRMSTNVRRERSKRFVLMVEDVRHAFTIEPIDKVGKGIDADL